jgi:radical SAM protein with 4Fe4S-binding SPASM domain
MRETAPFIDAFVDEWKDSGVDDVCVTEFMMWHNTVEDRRVAGASNGNGYNPCAAPFRHGCILADGTVVPCCMDVNGQMPLGNVTETPFHEVWFNNRYRQFRLDMLAGSLPPDAICSGCCNMFREAT